VYDAIGEELKKMREKVGLKQKEVADMLGYTSPQFISNWERGISSPPVKTIKQLANLYKTSPEKLFSKIQKAMVQQMRKEFDQSAG
jgi:transcriptional regulator with XRE-family HTH domain